MPDKKNGYQWEFYVFILIFLVSLFYSIQFAAKSYRSLAILNSAQSLSIPQSANIRGWMTIGFIAKSYQVELNSLFRKAGLPDDTDPLKTLYDLADQSDIETYIYVKKLQEAISVLYESGPVQPALIETGNLFNRFTDYIKSALLVYGLPVLALIIFLGALSLPVPAGPLTSISGMLCFQGEIDAFLVVVTVLSFSLLGDIVGYLLGRKLDSERIEKWGRWPGYHKSRARVEKYFNNWGGLTIILTRSLVAHISIIVGVFAGTRKYKFIVFLGYSLVGRLIWVGAYFTIGYFVSNLLEVASGFLGFVSLFLISALVVSFSAFRLSRTTKKRLW